MTPVPPENVVQFVREHYTFHREVMEAIDHLIGERDRARDLAVRCGAFETWTGTDVETYVER